LSLFIPTAFAADYTEVSDNDEISAYFSGHTLKGIEIESGTDWTEYYDPTGKVCYRIDDTYAAGRWMVRDGQACFQYKDTDGLLCYKVLERKGFKYMSYTSGPNAGVVGFVVTQRIEGNSDFLGLDAACSGGGT